MDLNSLMIDSGPPIYYNVAMRNVFEDHMEYLRNHPGTQVIAIPASAAYHYQNNLQGLFQSLDIAPQYHFIVMRMNHFTSFTSTLNDTLTLMIPNMDEIAHIVQSYTGTNGI